jgi:hypothetical protein
MFQRVLQSWGRLVGWGGEAPAAQGERRVWVRYPCELETTCRPANDVAPQGFQVRVQDISRGGIHLLVNRRFEPGALLSVDLPGAGDGSGCTALAYVVRVSARPGGDWAVGCTFATELGDEDLGEFGARRLKPEEPDQRTWQRFACEARASCRPVKAPTAEPFPVLVLNIAPGGLGLRVGQAIDLGVLLSVELHGPKGEPGLTMMASVVRVNRTVGPAWVLGCNFIRELTETEMRSLL